MISIDSTTDEDFERHTLAILQRELGLDATTIQEIMAEVESRRTPAA
jgi:hypothetical protein